MAQGQPTTPHVTTTSSHAYWCVLDCIAHTQIPVKRAIARTNNSRSWAHDPTMARPTTAPLNVPAMRSAALLRVVPKAAVCSTTIVVATEEASHSKRSASQYPTRIAKQLLAAIRACVVCNPRIRAGTAYSLADGCTATDAVVPEIR
jgi:hypothetical protein